MYARIIVDIASEQTDRLFIYSVPEDMKLVTGMRVEVPFQNRNLEGFVLELTEICDFDPKKLKAIIRTFEDYPVLLPHQISLAYEMREKYHCPLCYALRMMIPAGIRHNRVKVKTESCVQLMIPPDEAAKLAEKEKRSKKRRMFLNILSDGEIHPVKEIGVVIRDPGEIIERFRQEKVIRCFEREVRRLPYRILTREQSSPFNPTASQQEALDELLPALKRRKGEAFLLHGVTGSGKTEVYMHMMRQVLSDGNGAIILVPEIVLTPQMTDWFVSRFGDNAAILHSRLSAGERYDEWRRIRSGEARIVIGARSAVFAPVNNLSLIVVDEEHEQTYISSSFPQYDARDIALMRVRREGGVLLLASATPSMLSYAMARRGDYTLLEMPERANGKPLPKVNIVDMREELRMGNKQMFSRMLLEKLQNCIRTGHQAILFLNRRGYAPSVKCRQCGQTLRCEACDVSMTYHTWDNSLHCHYCGKRIPLPEKCPVCQSTYLKPMGVGTQKVEEELKCLFPETGVIRLDVDTTEGKNAYTDLLNEFRSGRAQIMIGTQMIAKGLDFPGVTLVGAVLADMTLELPDWRSPERTYQLLVQVAGRAGRAGDEGEVVIQTYKPDHYAIRAAAIQDYRQFFAEEFERRKRDLYPPFTLMTRFLCESPIENDSSVTALALQDQLREFTQRDPAAARMILYMRCDMCPISKIQNTYRAQVLIKVLNNPKNSGFLQFCQHLTTVEWKAKVSFETDPASLA